MGAGIEEPGERRLEPPPSGGTRLADMASQCAPMRRLHRDATRAVRRGAHIVITGPRGAGKGTLARSLHARGTRQTTTRPNERHAFLRLGCATCSESEQREALFGAAASSENVTPGLLARARGGTLFLEEIAALAPRVQVELLDAVEANNDSPRVRNGRVTEVRLIASSSRDLAEEVSAGRLRPDLFYRLDAAGLHLPPLRDRVEDLPGLVDAFVRRYSSAHKVRVSPDAFGALEAHPWPGNLRELRLCIERALLISQATVLAADDLMLGRPPAVPLDSMAETSLEGLFALLAARRTPLHELESRYIGAVLDQSRDNRSEAARVLGLDRTTLYRKLRSRSRPAPD